MKSEDFARNIMIRENYLSPDFTNERPGTDKRVYAFAYTSTFLGRGRGLSITVYNHSDKSIDTERLFRECVILANDGKRYDRSHPEMEWRRDALLPGRVGTFNISFPGVDLKTKDIRMIIFSFGLGETKIFLFPIAPPSETQKTEAKKPEAKKTETKKITEKKPSPKIEKTTVKEEPKAPLKLQCFAPVKMMQSFLGGLGKKVGDVAHSAKPREPKSPEVPAPHQEVHPAHVAEMALVPEDKHEEFKKSSQVIEGVTFNFRPNFRTAVQAAEKETVKMVYRDRPWSIDQPDQEMLREAAFRVSNGVLPRAKAKVVIVNAQYIFIVFDAGLEDGVIPNSIVSVLREGRLVGKAMASKVRDRISAAVILPEWRTKDRIKVGDEVSLAD